MKGRSNICLWTLSGVTFLWSAARCGGGAFHSGNIEAGNKAQARLGDNRLGSHLARLRAGGRLPEARPLRSPFPVSPAPPVTHLLPARTSHLSQGCVWGGREGEWRSRRCSDVLRHGPRAPGAGWCGGQGCSPGCPQQEGSRVSRRCGSGHQSPGLCHSRKSLNSEAGVGFTCPC